MSRMNLVSKLHHPLVIEKITQTNWTHTNTLPLVVEFDPTSACDLACPGCISGELLNKERFSRDRVLSLTKEMIDAGVRAVILIGGGEPLTHPAIAGVLQLLGEAGVQIGITTNGTLIDRHIDLIAKYASWTRVSVDSATPETFQHLRPSRTGQSRFDEVIRNMKLLAGRKSGILGYSFLIRTAADGNNEHVAGGEFGFGRIQQTNVHEIFEAAKLARDIGCDYFEPKPSYDDNHYLIIHDSDAMAIARDQIAMAKELETDTFHIIESVNLRHSIEGRQMEPQPKSYTSCPSTQLRTLVTPSGVYVCPYFRGNDTKKIGDVTTSSFLDMWTSTHRSEVMGRLNPCTDCGMHCIRHETNLELFSIRQLLAAGAPVTTVNSDDPDLFI